MLVPGIIAYSSCRTYCLRDGFILIVQADVAVPLLVLKDHRIRCGRGGSIGGVLLNAVHSQEATTALVGWNNMSM